jgi:hypothetical protein
VGSPVTRAPADRKRGAADEVTWFPSSSSSWRSAGATAVVGFGIGSLLAPLLALDRHRCRGGGSHAAARSRDGILVLATAPCDRPWRGDAVPVTQRRRRLQARSFTRNSARR